MVNNLPPYPYTAETARRNDETALFNFSCKANKNCAALIDRLIAESNPADTEVIG